MPGFRQHHKHSVGPRGRTTVHSSRQPGNSLSDGSYPSAQGRPWWHPSWLKSGLPSLLYDRNAGRKRFKPRLSGSAHQQGTGSKEPPRVAPPAQASTEDLQSRDIPKPHWSRSAHQQGTGSKDSPRVAPPAQASTEDLQSYAKNAQWPAGYTSPTQAHLASLERLLKIYATLFSFEANQQVSNFSSPHAVGKDANVPTFTPVDAFADLASHKRHLEYVWTLIKAFEQVPSKNFDRLFQKLQGLSKKATAA